MSQYIYMFLKSNVKYYCFPISNYRLQQQRDAPDQVKPSRIKIIDLNSCSLITGILFKNITTLNQFRSAVPHLKCTVMHDLKEGPAVEEISQKNIFL